MEAQYPEGDCYGGSCHQTTERLRQVSENDESNTVEGLAVETCAERCRSTAPAAACALRFCVHRGGRPADSSHRRAALHSREV